MAGLSTERAGTSVSLSADGMTALVGAPGVTTSLGRARAYRWNSTNWARMGTLDSEMEGAAASNLAGTSVSLSAGGTVALVGSPGHGANLGTARVYIWNEGLFR